MTKNVRTHVDTQSMWNMHTSINVETHCGLFCRVQLLVCLHEERLCTSFGSCWTSMAKTQQKIGRYHLEWRKRDGMVEVHTMDGWNTLVCVCKVATSFGISSESPRMILGARGTGCTKRNKIAHRLFTVVLFDTSVGEGVASEGDTRVWRWGDGGRGASRQQGGYHEQPPPASKKTSL